MLPIKSESVIFREKYEKQHVRYIDAQFGDFIERALIGKYNTKEDLYNAVRLEKELCDTTVAYNYILGKRLKKEKIFVKSMAKLLTFAKTYGIIKE